MPRTSVRVMDINKDVAILVNSIGRIIVAPLEELWRIIELEIEIMDGWSFDVLSGIKILNPHEAEDLKTLISLPDFSSQEKILQWGYLAKCWMFYDKLRDNATIDLSTYGMGIIRMLFGTLSKEKVMNLISLLDLNRESFILRVIKEIGLEDSIRKGDNTKMYFLNRVRDLVGDMPYKNDRVTNVEKLFYDILPSWFCKILKDLTFIVSADTSSERLGSVIRVSEDIVYMNRKLLMTAEATVSKNRLVLKYFNPSVIQDDLSLFPKHSKWLQENYGWMNIFKELPKRLEELYDISKIAGIEGLPSITCTHKSGELYAFVKSKLELEKFLSVKKNDIFGYHNQSWTAHPAMRIPRYKMFEIIPGGDLGKITVDYSIPEGNYKDQLEAVIPFWVAENCEVPQEIDVKFYKRFKRLLKNSRSQEESVKSHNEILEQHLLSSYLLTFSTSFILSFLRRVLMNKNISHPFHLFYPIVQLFLMVGLIYISACKVLLGVAANYSLSLLSMRKNTYNEVVKCLSICGVNILYDCYALEGYELSVNDFIHHILMFVIVRFGEFCGEKSSKKLLYAKPSKKSPVPSKLRKKKKENGINKVSKVSFYLVYHFMNEIQQILGNTYTYISSYWNRNDKGLKESPDKSFPDCLHADKSLKQHLIDKPSPLRVRSSDCSSKENYQLAKAKDEKPKNNVRRRKFGSKIVLNDLNLGDAAGRDHPFIIEMRIVNTYSKRVSKNRRKGFDSIHDIFDRLDNVLGDGCRWVISGGAALSYIKFLLGISGELGSIHDIDIIVPQGKMKNILTNDEAKVESSQFKAWLCDTQSYEPRAKKIVSVDVKVDGRVFPPVEIREFKHADCDTTVSDYISLSKLLSSECSSSYSSVKVCGLMRDPKSCMLYILFPDKQALTDLYERKIGLRISQDHLAAPEWVFLVLDMLCLGYSMGEAEHIFDYLKKYGDSRRPQPFKIIEMIKKYHVRHGWKYYQFIREFFMKDAQSYLYFLFSHDDEMRSLSLKEYKDLFNDTAFLARMNTCQIFQMTAIFSAVFHFKIKNDILKKVMSYFTECKNKSFEDVGISHLDFLTQIERYIYDLIISCFQEIGVVFYNDNSTPDYVLDFITNLKIVSNKIANVYISCMQLTFDYLYSGENLMLEGDKYHKLALIHYRQLSCFYVTICRHYIGCEAKNSLAGIQRLTTVILKYGLHFPFNFIVQGKAYISYIFGSKGDILVESIKNAQFKAFFDKVIKLVSLNSDKEFQHAAVLLIVTHEMIKDDVLSFFNGSHRRVPYVVRNQYYIYEQLFKQLIVLFDTSVFITYGDQSIIKLNKMIEFIANFYFYSVVGAPSALFDEYCQLILIFRQFSQITQTISHAIQNMHFTEGFPSIHQEHGTNFTNGTMFHYQEDISYNVVGHESQSSDSVYEGESESGDSAIGSSASYSSSDNLGE